MSKIWIVGTFLVGILSFSAEAQEVVLHERYVGILRHQHAARAGRPEIESMARDQLAKIDFIQGEKTGDETKLVAIVTFHLGGFESGEYVSYHFDQGKLNSKHRQIELEDVDQPVSIFSTKFTGDILEADVTSIYSGRTAKLLLAKDGPAVPQLPLLEPISGEFQGTCQGTPTRLQVLTYRSSKEMKHTSHSFGPYEIRGLMGQPTKPPLFGCGGPGQEECILGIIEEGEYNYFEEKLRLSGPQSNLDCRTKPDGIYCRNAFARTECNFKRTSDEMKAPRLSTAPLRPPGWPKKDELGIVALRSGEYMGYVYHEYLDQYQLTGLHFLVSPAVNPPGAYVATTAMLYFGKGPGEGEDLGYQFRRTHFARKVPEVVLSLREEDVDAIVRVTSVEGDTVKGVWYSRLFGRVGPFTVKLGALPELPPDSVVMEAFGRAYVGERYQLELRANRGTSPVNTENPFIPNLLGGWFHTPETKRHPIEGRDGSYDFYTGRVSIVENVLTSKNSFLSHWVGYRARNQQLVFRRRSPILANAMSPWNKLFVFKPRD